MRKAWLLIGMFALASTACSHPQVETGVAPPVGALGASGPARETATALYVIDGVIVGEPIAAATPQATPLLVIDGVPVVWPTP